MRLLLFTVLALAPFAVAQDDDPVENGSFEDELTAWTATVATDEFAHTAGIDLAQQHSGKCSLKLSSPARTFVAKTVVQRIEARPGGLYKLGAWCRSEQLERDLNQAQEAYVSLAFLDEFERVLTEKKRRPRVPHSDWHTVGVGERAPERCRSVEIRIHCSLSGTLWVDDVSLFISGGRKLQKTEVLLREDFTGVDAIPERWTTVVGARHGNAGATSTVAFDDEVGAPSNFNSIRLEGDAGCVAWLMIGTEIAVEPGDDIVMKAMVKASTVRQEGNQYRNLHINIDFLDAKGKRLAFLTGDCGFGSYGWKAVDLPAVAPAGTARARVGFFLSNSGRAWIDRIEVLRTGNSGTSSGWPETATEHLDVKYSPDHPRAAAMSRHANALEEAYLAIRKALDVRYSERITVMLYRDDQQGAAMTGRRLNFAEPKERRVHMRPNATRGHEMVHVIAEAIGSAGTALFGEGIAVWLDTQGGKFHHVRAAALLEEDRLPSLDVLLNDFRSDEKLTYRAAGSFIGFLIQTHGLDVFKQLYVLRDPRIESKPHLGMHLETAFGRWKEFLAAGKF